MGFFDDYIEAQQKPGQSSFLDDYVGKEIDTSTGAPFGQRAAASIKVSPEGKLNYLKSIYGPENVQMIEAGQTQQASETLDPITKMMADPNVIGGASAIAAMQPDTPKPSEARFVYRNPKTNKWTLFDETGMSWGDIADMTGGAIEAAPAVAAGIATQSPVIAGAASMGGNLLRQVASALIPGKEEMGMGERGLQAGTSAVLGVATQGAANIAMKWVDKFLRPQNILRKYVSRRTDPVIIQEGEQLAGQTGIDLSAGQITGNRDVIAIEGYLRQSPLSRGMFFEKDVARAKQFESYFESMLARVSPERLGKEATGARVSHAYGKYFDSLIDLRSKVGGKAFDEFKKLAGNEQIIPINNAIAEIDGVINDVYTRFGTDTANQMIEGLKKLKGRMVDEATGEVSSLTPNEFKRSLSIYSNAAYGTGDVIKDLDKSTNKMIATRVYKGLLKDLDDAADSGLGGDAVAALKTARDTWKQLSAPIDAAKSKVLAKTLKMVDEETGIGGEKVVDKLTGTSWTPSQLRDSMQIIEAVDPVAARNVRAEMLETIWNKAEYAGSAKQIGGGTTSPAKVSTGASKMDEYVKAIFANDQPGYEAWKKLTKVAGRMADTAGMTGSQTAPFQLIDKLITAGWGSTRRMLSGDILGPVTDLAKVLTPRKFAKVMLDRDARHSLMTLVESKASTKAAIAAAEKLSVFVYRDDLADYVSGLGEANE